MSIPPSLHPNLNTLSYLRINSTKPAIKSHSNPTTKHLSKCYTITSNVTL